jgi:hypothetical protein
MPVRLRARLPGWVWLFAPSAWTPDTGWYIAYRLADYVVLNLGEDAALLALAFC